MAEVREAPRAGEKDATCPTCGAPAERGQLICLECGSRIALSYRRPPSWKLPAAIVGVIALLAGAAAVIGLDALDDDAKEEVAAQPPARVKDTGKADSGEKGAAQKGGQKEKSEQKAGEEKASEKKAGEEELPAEEAEPKPAVGADGVESWPDGEDAFTVVILSSEDRSSARAFAQNAVKSGVDAGLLRADDYPALSASTGFFIVFVGQYPNQAKADAAAARLGRRFQGAYPQFVDGSKAKR